MERSANLKMAKRDLESLISELNGNEILSTEAMRSVRGGDGDGGADGILIPPKQV